MATVTRSRRVLWVTEEPPDRQFGGGSIRQAYLFDSLAAAFPVDLLAVGSVKDDQVRAAAARIVELQKKSVLMPENVIGRRALQLAITLGSPYPLFAYWARPARRALLHAIGRQRGRYDLICIEHETLAPLISASRGERWIITFHSLLSGMIATQVPLAPRLRQRWFRERDLRKARTLEQRTLQRYDRCVVCSNEDATTLSAIAGEGAANRVTVIPNGVDLAQFREFSLPREPRVLFPGTFAYPPNVDGARWFCSEIWPRILDALPNATLILAGRAPLAEVLELGELPGVSVHPDVPSMVPYFESARVVVVPLRVGTGTRLKALEAMAARRPLVGTTVGLQGIGVVDGIQALIADNPEAISAAVRAVLSHDDLANSLAQAGRAHVESRFGWDRIGQQFVRMASKLLDGEKRYQSAARSSSSAA